LQIVSPYLFSIEPDASGTVALDSLILDGSAGIRSNGPAAAFGPVRGLPKKSNPTSGTASHSEEGRAADQVSSMVLASNAAVIPSDRLPLMVEGRPPKTFVFAF
jgi:hypothetical protein